MSILEIGRWYSSALLDHLVRDQFAFVAQNKTIWPCVLARSEFGARHVPVIVVRDYHQRAVGGRPVLSLRPSACNVDLSGRRLQFLSQRLHCHVHARGLIPCPVLHDGQLIVLDVHAASN